MKFYQRFDFWNYGTAAAALPFAVWLGFPGMLIPYGVQLAFGFGILIGKFVVVK